MSGTEKKALAAVLIFGAVFAVYAPALSNGFLAIWDDPAYITANPDIAGITLAHLKAVFSHIYVENYAPIHLLSYMMDYALYGLSAAGFHLTNNLVHGFNGALVFLLIYRVSKDLSLSILSALLFALHPVQVESVVWLSERKTILAAAFGLGSFLVFLRFLDRRGRGLYVSALLLFAAALLSKASVVILPLLFLVYLLLFPHEKRHLWFPVIPFFLLAAAGAVLTVMTQRRVIVPYYGGSPYATALTMLPVLAEYLRIFLFPFNLSPSYQPVIYRTFFTPQVFLSLLFLLMLVFLVWRLRRDREVLFWAAWVFIPLLPVLQIIPFVTIMNDRYLYLSLIGMAPLMVKTIRRAAGRNGAVMVTALILALILPQTISRARLWRPGPDLWLDAIRHYPENETLYLQLATVYQKGGRIRAAETAFRKAAAIDSGDLTLHKKYGALLMQAGRDEDAKRELQRVYDAGRRDVELLSNLAYACLDTGDPVSALQHFREALSMNDRDANSIYGMAMVHERMGKWDRAADFWRRFLEVTPPNNAWRGKVEQSLRRDEAKAGGE
ncbi:MAG: tetratricopeptide repeat protein [Deltaproteobacteria bacterium]|nr:tetratricopeptide repeat protein [Deltaproteobacteria bacterium]